MADSADPEGPDDVLDGVEVVPVWDEVPDAEVPDEHAAQSNATRATAPASVVADREGAGLRSGAGGRTSGERETMARLLPHRRVGFPPGADDSRPGRIGAPGPPVAGTLGLVRLASGGIT